MSITNILLSVVVLIGAGAAVAYFIKKNKNAEVETEIEKDDKTYTLDQMKNYVKKRLDEITKINLYDIGLSEEELKRRKNKKYALKYWLNEYKMIKYMHKKEDENEKIWLFFSR